MRVFEARGQCVRSQQREEVLDRELRLLQDVGERRALDRPVCRHDELERVVRRVLLQADVTAALSHDDPACPLERADDPIVGERGDFRQTAISTSSADSRPTVSSSTGSR